MPHALLNRVATGVEQLGAPQALVASNARCVRQTQCRTGWSLVLQHAICCNSGATRVGQTVITSHSDARRAMPIEVVNNDAARSGQT